MPRTQTQTMLVRAATAFAGCAVVSAGLLLSDTREVDGALVWLKPLKFSVSLSLYTATLAWIFGELPSWPRLTARVGALTVFVFALELALIAFQSARGRASHFNSESVLDGVIFATMGASIAVQTVGAGAVAWASWKQPFVDQARGLAVRWGMTLAVAGASAAWLMAPISAAQSRQWDATNEVPPRLGTHTVGSDARVVPTMPLTGWNTEHGDLRVPHFVGLHAMQVVPLVALTLGRRRSPSARRRLARVVGGSYGLLFLLLLVQAMTGASVAAPSFLFRALFAAWALGSFALGWWAYRGHALEPT